jgi:hypothetical protein
MGMETCVKSLVGEPEGNRSRTDIVVLHWRDNIKIDVKQDGREWSEFIWLRINTLLGCCEYCNARSGFIICKEFLDH